MGWAVLTLQFEDWFRLVADPSVHSAVSVLLDCLLRSYSFSYVEKKSLERQRNRTGGHPLSPSILHLSIHYQSIDRCQSCAFTVRVYGQADRTEGLNQ